MKLIKYLVSLSSSLRTRERKKEAAMKERPVCAQRPSSWEKAAVKSK
jgi:hypothetical protein